MANESINAIPKISRGTKGRFKWFTNTAMAGQPDPFPDPWIRLQFEDRRPFPSQDQNNDPTQPLTHTSADFWAARQQAFLLDYEVGATSVTYSKSQTDASITKRRNILTWVKEQQPNMPCGIYDTCPIGEYYRVVANDITNQQWKADNAYLNSFGRLWDFHAPSWYITVDNIGNWVKWAELHTLEARKFGRPIYPYVWHLYHGSVGAPNAGTYIGNTWYQLILDTAQRLVDGIILFGVETWDDNAPWWLLANAAAQATL